MDGVTLEDVRRLMAKFPDKRIWDYLEIMMDNGGESNQLAFSLIIMAAQGLCTIEWDEELQQPAVRKAAGLERIS